MLPLTKQERKVLLLIGLTLCFGSTANILFKRFPLLADTVNLIDSPRLYPKTNINTAGAVELEALPYIGKYTAGEILKHREQFGLFHSVEDVKKVKGIREKNFSRFRDYITVE